MKKIALIGFMLWSAWVHADETVSPPGRMKWYRGSTHVHSINNGGNATADGVVRWFREHGYQFVFITDHEFVTDVAALNAIHGASGLFLTLPGEEVTQMLVDPSHPEGLRHAHVNGLGLNKVVLSINNENGPHTAAGMTMVAAGMTMSELYQRNFAEVRKAGGIPQINHPNYRWSVRPEDLAELSGVFLLEIANEWPLSNNLGGTDDKGNVSLSTEALWDRLLTEGKTVWGVASDDSHDYQNLIGRIHEGPGKGWIVVRAAELTSNTILNAMLKGEFYASNGVTLKDYVVDDTSITITIKPAAPTPFSRVTDDRRFMTRFIGNGGQVLAEVPGMKPTYQFNGSETYVRASITDSNGLQAWTQPVILKSRRR